jgi:hypothetical protein
MYIDKCVNSSARWQDYMYNAGFPVAARKTNMQNTAVEASISSGSGFASPKQNKTVYSILVHMQ